MARAKTQGNSLLLTLCRSVDLVCGWVNVCFMRPPVFNECETSSFFCCCCYFSSSLCCWIIPIAIIVDAHKYRIRLMSNKFSFYAFGLPAVAQSSRPYVNATKPPPPRITQFLSAFVQNANWRVNGCATISPQILSHSSFGFPFFSF